MLKLKFITVILIFLLLYILSFVGFVSGINFKSKLPKDIEAIVILTGSKERLDKGFKLLEENSNILMLITGVGDGVKYSDLVQSNELNFENISLGFKAKNTFQNALETSEWVKENNIKNYILLTDNWHMQRALLFFKSIMPDLSVSPLALEVINLNNLLFKPKILITIFIEHLKYIISHFQILFYWLIN